MPLKETSDQEIFKSKYLSVREKTFEEWDPWQYVTRWKGIVAGLLIHEENDSFIFLDQYRYPIGDRILSLVAWIIDKEGLSSEQTFREEVAEEAWYKKVDRVEFVTKSSTDSWWTDQIVDLYYGYVSWEKWEQDLDQSEDINVLEVKIDDFDRFFTEKMSQWIIDPFVGFLWYMYIAKHRMKNW